MCKKCHLTSYNKSYIVFSVQILTRVNWRKLHGRKPSYCGTHVGALNVAKAWYKNLTPTPQIILQKLIIAHSSLWLYCSLTCVKQSQQILSLPRYHASSVLTLMPLLSTSLVYIVILRES